MLSKIAWYKTETAYSCFITGFKHKPKYFMRTIPNISNQLKHLDKTVRTEFIPAKSGGINCSYIERKLLPFLPKLGGLGIPILSEIADRKYKFSRMISKNLTTNIINQHHQNNSNATNIKNKIKQMKLQHHQDELSKLQNNLSDNQRRLLEPNQEEGTSSWLTTLPITYKQLTNNLPNKTAILRSKSDQMWVGCPKITS